MTLTTVSSSILDTVFSIIRRKEAHIKEWKAIAKLEANKALIWYEFRDKLWKWEWSAFIRDRTEESIEEFTKRKPWRIYIIRYIIDLL